jgi:hypothetical protein
VNAGNAKPGNAKAKITHIEEPTIEEISVLVAGSKRNDNKIYLTSKSIAKLSQDTWILDSGASWHVTNDQHMMTTYNELASLVHIWMADNSLILMQGIRFVYMDAVVNGQKPCCLFKDVLYAPRMARHLISVQQLTDNSF